MIALIAWIAWEPQSVRRSRTTFTPTQATHERPDPETTSTGRRGRMRWWNRSGGPALVTFQAGGRAHSGRAGFFDTTLPDGIYMMRNVVVDGMATAHDHELLVLEAGVEPVLWFDPPVRPTIHVVDRGSGQPIANARVYESTGGFGWYPDAATLARTPTITGADGTARLPLGRGLRQIVVHAPGFAWRPDSIEGPAKTILLEPGCQLSVFVPDTDICPGTYLKLGNQELPVTAPRMLFDGLYASTREVKLCRGHSLATERPFSYESPDIVIETQRIDLSPGRAATVEFKPWVDRSTWIHEVWGRVTLADGWPAGELSVAVFVEPRNSAALGNAIDWYWVARAPVTNGKFVIRGIAPGEYQFEVLPTAYMTAVKLHRGDEEVHLHVPPPLNVQLHIADAETKQPVLNAKLHYTVHGLSQPRVIIDAGSHRVFLNTWGFQDVWATALNYEFTDTVRPGRFGEDGLVHTLELEPRATLLVELTRNGEPVPTSDGHVDLGEHASEVFRRGRALFDEVPAGKYALRFELPDALTAELPISVQLRKREQRVLRVEVR